MDKLDDEGLEGVLRVAEEKRILKEAAAYLEARGWNRGGYGKPGGPRCVLGAIVSASEEGEGGVFGPRTLGAIARLHRSLFSPFFHTCDADGQRISIAAWNDRDFQIKDEVCAALRRAAEEG